MNQTIKNYLQTKRLSGNTVTAYSKRVENFIVWKTNENIQLSDLNYNDMLRYIANLRQKSYSNRYINQLLCIVRYYLDYKLIKGETETPVAIFRNNLKAMLARATRSELEEIIITNIAGRMQKKSDNF